MRNTIPFVFSILLVLTACDRGLMNRKVSEDDVSIKGLLDSLHLKVATGNPLLVKTGFVDHNFDSAKIHLDKEGWNREFQIFNELKISPGRLEGRYNKVVSQDSLTHIRYVGKDPENLQLDSFHVSLNEDHELLGIQAFINYSNSLNTTKQKLEMDFRKWNEEVLPAYYSTRGWQKMKLKDTVRFAIQSRLEY